MATVSWTQHLQTHIDVEAGEISGATVREALDAVFEKNPRLKRYVLDDSGAVRKHIGVFLNGDSVRDRTQLSDPLPPDGEIHVLQALSGG